MNFESKSKYYFFEFDIFNEWQNIIPTDLCIIKDVLQHWRTSEIIYFLDQIILLKKCKYILICNCATQSEDRFNDIDGGLSCIYYPLKKYNPEIVLKYKTKEVSLINVV